MKLTTMWFKTKIPILIILVMFVLSISINQSYAAKSERLVEVGPTTLVYRDIDNLGPTTEPTISTDKAIYHIGEDVILTINDFNANVDLEKKDNIVATITFASSTLDKTLEETDVNTGLFAVKFPFQGSFSASYASDPPDSPRASVTLDITTPGKVILEDSIITESEIVNMCMNPVSNVLKVTFDGAEAEGDLVVTISYANLLDFTPFPANIKMFYKIPGGNWNCDDPIAPSLSENPDTVAWNTDLLRITSHPEETGYIGTVAEGEYVLGTVGALGGGGGGGLIRPGLVLNLLAGVNFGSGGPDRLAPSLQFGEPEANQDGFGGILLTDDNKNAFPLVINNKGYYLPEFSNTIDPVQVTTDQDVNLTLTFLELTGVQHIAMHFVDQNNDEISENDPTITYDNESVSKSDPQGVLADDITFSKSKEGNKYSFNFGFSFDKPGNRHLIVTAWDEHKNSGNTKIFNAFSVSGEQIPDEGIGHMIYLDLGAFFITPNGVWTSGEKVTAAQPVIEYVYPDSVGRAERHDGIMGEMISDERSKASQVMASKFNLDTQRFVADDEIKPYDPSRRAAELSLSSVGHKIRDFTLSPQENKELIKDLAWQEHLKAQKILDLLLSKQNQ